MVTNGHGGDLTPLQISFAPQVNHPSLPVEVVRRGELIERVSRREIAARQRADFHQLVVCTEGQGAHLVDFQRIEMRPGTLLRIHPGQVQSFVVEPRFEATMVIWPDSTHHGAPGLPAWFPGSGAPMCWQHGPGLLERTLGWIDELRTEQRRYVATAEHQSLMGALLCAFLMRLAIEVPGASPIQGDLPEAYVSLRAEIERSLHRRPTVAELASDLGSSTRTLDRACQQVTGQTAKAVVDERVALEIRRVLTHSDWATARVASAFGFTDPSNFSKFVKRHLGALPGEVREAAKDHERPG